MVELMKSVTHNNLPLFASVTDGDLYESLCFMDCIDFLSENPPMLRKRSATPADFARTKG